MAHGSGPYDDLAVSAMRASQADAVVVIVLGGEKGSAYSVTAERGVLALPRLVEILRAVADEIEHDGMAYVD